MVISAEFNEALRIRRVPHLVATPGERASGRVNRLG
jgi:hypothetical protein